MVVIVTKMGTSSFTLKLQIPSGERGKRRRRGWSTVNWPMTILYPAQGFSQRSLTLFPATRVLWGHWLSGTLTAIIIKHKVHHLVSQPQLSLRGEQDKQQKIHQ